jgi:hypothetical protein
MHDQQRGVGVMSNGLDAVRAGRVRKGSHAVDRYGLPRSMSAGYAAVLGRRGSAGAAPPHTRRAGLSAARSVSLESLGTAQHMFGAVLGALGKATGPADAAGAAGSLAALGVGGSGAEGRNGVTLFNAGWSHAKWAAGSGELPSILSVRPELFATSASAAANELATVLSAALPAGGGAAGGPPPAKAPPVPLFC